MSILVTLPYLTPGDLPLAVGSCRAERSALHRSRAGCTKMNSPSPRHPQAGKNRRAEYPSRSLLSTELVSTCYPGYDPATVTASSLNGIHSVRNGLKSVLRWWRPAGRVRGFRRSMPNTSTKTSDPFAHDASRGAAGQLLMGARSSSPSPEPSNGWWSGWTRISAGS